MSYSAWCRQYGEHSTHTVGYRCWNQEGIETMTTDMSDYWESFSADIEAHLDMITDFIDDTLGNIIRDASPEGMSKAQSHTH